MMRWRTRRIINGCAAQQLADVTAAAIGRFLSVPVLERANRDGLENMTHDAEPTGTFLIYGLPKKVRKLNARFDVE